MDQIELTCDTGAAAECSALQSALAMRAPKADILLSTAEAAPLEAAGKDMLRVHLEILRRAPDFIIARLVWSMPGQSPVAGPHVEVASIDTTLTSQAQKRLAQGLLQASDLPI